MKGISILMVLMTFLIACSNSSVDITDLRCEYRSNPLGIDNLSPRLSWKLMDNPKERGQKQIAYQVVVSSSAALANNNEGDLWDSGKQPSIQSVNVVYRGAQLTSGQEAFWKVRVWDNQGNCSAWSEPATFSVGLLNAEDWKGQWIHKKENEKRTHIWYRKNITLQEKPLQAAVYLASLGYHELYVNGQKVTENVLNPVQSYMKKRNPYLTYEISEYLNKGDNVIAVWHAAGWSLWRRIREYRNIPFVFKGQVEIMCSEQSISLGTDTTWKCKRSNSEYYGDWDILRFGGETIDDRLAEPQWNFAAYDDSDWENAVTYDHRALNAILPEGDNLAIALNSRKNRSFRADYAPITAELSAQRVEPQVKYATLTPTSIKKNKDGSFCVDMGENYTGFFEMNLYNGQAGDSVLFEIADQEGERSTWNQNSKYIYGASGKGQFSNRFNVAGGRWVTVYGLD